MFHVNRRLDLISSPVRTASEVADLGPAAEVTFGDEATPLAKAAEHMLRPPGRTQQG